MKAHGESLDVASAGRRLRLSTVSGMRSPVIYWAIVGAAFLCLAAWIWGSWIFSPWFRPVPLGSDPVPLNVKVAVRAVEVVSTLLGLFMLWKFVISPILRQRELPWDGLLLINFLLIWWTDPMNNYINYCFMYNGYFINMGSWANFIPGLSYPNLENFPEPLLMMGGFYLGFWLLTVLFGCWMLRTLEQRFPGTGFGWHLAVLLMTMAIIDLVVENIFMRLGVTAVPATVHSLTLFAGKVYQWPIYEGITIGAVVVGFTCLRHLRNDKGQSFVERGIERLDLSAGKKKVITFLAMAGFLQPFYAILTYLPIIVFSIHADTCPAYPSYMRTGVCGEGTRYACPSRYWVPIPTRDSALVVGPDDPRLPPDVRNKQGLGTGKDPYAW